MGCGTSSGAEGPGVYDDDKDFLGETGARTKFDKKSGKGKALKDGIDDGAANREDDFFAVEEAGEGEQFMAVRPWIGQVAEPDSHNDVNKAQPDQRYGLEYVYGYRCADSRQNAYLNSAGQCVYMTAALGVVLDHTSNTQKFFGGGEVENCDKKYANDQNGHTNDIMAIALSTCRTRAVSGQVGPAPTVFVWDAATGEKVQRFKVSKGARGINAVAMSQDGSLVACVDLSNDHMVHVFECSSGSQILKQKGDSNKIYDVCFSQQPGSTVFSTAGTKHCYFWNAKESGGNKKKCLFGTNPMTSFACCTYDSDGMCYTGGSNAKIYVWKDRDCQQTIDAHSKGFICTIRWNGGKLYSGGKDGKVAIINTGSMAIENTLDFGNPIRAVDCDGTSIVAGLRNGSIFHCGLDGSNMKGIMHSHNEGEVWGLDCDDAGNIWTSADDNQVLAWDPAKRERVMQFKVTDRNAKSKRGGASTLSNLPDSKCSRAVAVHGNDIAVAGNDGCVMIKDLATGADKVTLSDSTEWIEVMHYSPDGSMLGVGSHDNDIYIYNVADGYSLKGKLQAHKSFIVCFDWCTHNEYIRSDCGAHELLFFQISTMKQDPSGRSNTTGVTWASNTCKFGWNVEGIFPSGTDGTHINGVHGSKDGMLLATGDDYGLVNVFRDPCRFGGVPRSLRGHSEHVVRVMFCKDDEYLFSVGGYDQTLMQWKKK